jgi:hypothetical protein
MSISFWTRLGFVDRNTSPKSIYNTPNGIWVKIL